MVYERLGFGLEAGDVGKDGMGRRETKVSFAWTCWVLLTWDLLDLAGGTYE